MPPLPDLVGPSRNAHSVGVRQWPLQRLSFILWRTHQGIPFFIGGQDHRHCLRMDRFDDRVPLECGL
jgi:hypothetical protein